MFDPLIPVLTYLVTAGVKEFFDKVLDIELDSKVSALIASVIAALALYANEIGKAIPAQFLPVIGAAVALVVAIASAFGIHATVKFFTE